jgi:hypothetical protein
MFLVLHKQNSIGIYAHQDKYREIEEVQRGLDGGPQSVAVGGVAVTNWFRK